jgi:glycosyltransferase involved in cell wall biosynthesis
LPGELPRTAAFVGVDLLLLPSRVEAFGMVVTEGLARGIPCFVSAGGPAEALGSTRAGDIPGLLVEPVETTLPTALRRWLTVADHRAELRRHALTRRTELTGWDVAATQLSEALAGLVP